MKKDLTSGIMIGFGVGAFVTALAMKKFIQEMIEEDKRIALRNLNMFNHMIDTMGPYVPKEVLEENLVFMQFQNIIMHEKGTS